MGRLRAAIVARSVTTRLPGEAAARTLEEVPHRTGHCPTTTTLAALVLGALSCAAPPPTTLELLEPQSGARLAGDELSLSGVTHGTAVASVVCRLDDGDEVELAVGAFGEFGAFVHADAGRHVLACRAGGARAVATVEVDSFVRVRDGALSVNGEPFRFVGVNAYYLHEEATRALRGSEEARGRLDEVLARATELGATVVRTWAFNDHPGHDTVLQRRPLVYDAEALEGLDQVIAAAGAHGLRLVLPLGNYWPDYGGVPQYLRWHGLRADAPQLFFTDPDVRAHYRAHIANVVGRTNSVTGVPYREDPTILAWELLNEPRGTGLDDGGAALAAWVTEMAGVVRGVDPNHLVGTGEEGFDAVGNLDAPAWNRLGAGEVVSPAGGSDFLANTAAVDFASVHVYPQAWGVPRAMAAEAGARWIAEHARLASSIDRPLVVGEFGLPSEELDRGARQRGWTAAERRAIYDRWLGTAGADPAVAGALSWVLMHDGRPDAWGPYAWTWTSGHPVELPHARYAELYRQYAALLRGGFL